MAVGACFITLYLHGNDSLKGKRQVVSSIKARVKNKFNIAIAEVAEQDNHRKIVLGIATVSADRSFTAEALEKAVRFIEELHLAEFLDSKMEIY